MEIKNILGSLDPYVKTEQSESGSLDKGRRKTESAYSNSRDRASVSPEAKLRAEGYSAALAAPEVRAEAVAALKAKIETGEYHIDARNIAEKMLEEEMELFS